MYNFSTFLTQFEAMLVLGIDKGIYTTQTNFWTAPQPPQNNFLYFKIQGDIDTDKVLVVSYYGVVRKSRGFQELGKKTKDKKIKTHLVQFSQVKIEHIYKLAPHLLEGFIPFKQQAIGLRWGNK